MIKPDDWNPEELSGLISLAVIHSDALNEEHSTPDTKQLLKLALQLRPTFKRAGMLEGLRMETEDDEDDDE